MGSCSRLLLLVQFARHHACKNYTTGHYNSCKIASNTILCAEEAFELIPSEPVPPEKIEAMFELFGADLGCTAFESRNGKQVGLESFLSMSGEERRAELGTLGFVTLRLQFTRPSEYGLLASYFAQPNRDGYDAVSNMGLLNRVVFEQRLDARVFLALAESTPEYGLVSKNSVAVLFDYVKFYNMDRATGQAAAQFIRKINPKKLEFKDMFDFTSDGECDYPTSSTHAAIEFWIAFFETIHCEDLQILSFENEYDEIPLPVFKCLVTAIRDKRFERVRGFTFIPHFKRREQVRHDEIPEVEVVRDLASAICLEGGMPHLDSLGVSSWIHLFHHIRAQRLGVEHSLTMAFLNYPRDESLDGSHLTYRLYFGHSELGSEAEDDLALSSINGWMTPKISLPVIWPNVREEICKKFHLEFYVSSIERFLHLYRPFAFTTQILPASMSIYPRHNTGYVGYEKWQENYIQRLSEMFQGWHPGKCWVKFYTPDALRCTGVTVECFDDDFGNRVCLPVIECKHVDCPSDELFWDQFSGEDVSSVEESGEDVSMEQSDGDDEDAMDEVAVENEVEFYEEGDSDEEDENDGAAAAA